MEKVTWSCACGKTRALVPTDGNRIVCYCKSCRAMVERLGKGGTLDPSGGSALFQVDPKDVDITQGIENLRYMKITEKGPLRWYTTCCNSPMANTIGNRALAFASFQVAGIAEKAALPKVSAKVNLKGATAHVEGPHGSALPLVGTLLAKTLRSWVSGAWKSNPFFDASGKPIAARRDP